MKLDAGADELRSLLDAASPATLTLYHEDGEAHLERRPPGWIVRLPMGSARAWSLADKISQYWVIRLGHR